MFFTKTVDGIVKDLNKNVDALHKLANNLYDKAIETHEQIRVLQTKEENLRKEQERAVRVACKLSELMR